MKSNASSESDQATRRSGIFGAVHGLAWIAAGTSVNPWLLAVVLKPIESPWKVAVLLVIETAFTVLGLLLIRRRQDRLLQFKCFALAFSTILSLISAEAILRMFVPDGAVRVLRENPHATGSFRLKPNINLQVPFLGKKIEIKTNEHGMRWRPVETNKPAGVKRIAFVGDSFTFGDWASDVEHSYVGRVEHELRKLQENKGGPVLEVMNFGVGGYGFDDMALIVTEEVLRFSPDVVVIGMFNGNDLRDTWLGKRKGYVADGILIPDVEWIQQRIPPEVNSRYGARAKHSGRLRQLTNRIALLKVSRKLFGSKHQKRPKRSSIQDFDINATDFTSYTFWNQRPYPEVAKKALQESKRVIAELNATLIRQNIQLMIAALPTQAQTYNPSLEGPGFDLRRPQSFLQTFAEEKSIPFIDLLERFRAEAQKKPTPELFAVPDIHYDDRGHALAGQAIALFLWNNMRVNTSTAGASSP